MKRLISIACGVGLLVASASIAWAACTTTTYLINGQVMVCTTCCLGASCTVTCF